MQVSLIVDMQPEMYQNQTLRQHTVSGSPWAALKTQAAVLYKQNTTNLCLEGVEQDMGTCITMLAT